MKKLFIAILIICISVLVIFTGTSFIYADTTKNYETKVLSNWQSGNFSDLWDLTQGDLVFSYTIDMSNIATAGWAVTEVGLRQVSAPNLDPNLKGGWMQSNYLIGGNNNTSRNNNDMHLLSKHGWLYQTYDAADSITLITPPYWSGNNHGFWFDRDGVDEWQDDLWGAAGTYNTGGIYNVVITYHAINNDTGTMFATINGVQQGLYIGDWKNAQPEFYPAGRSFIGNMANMQVFYGRGGGGGTVTLSNISVTGTLYWTEVSIDIKPGEGDTNPIGLKAKGLVPVAVLSTSDFDALTIVTSTVMFAGAEPVKYVVEDVNGDSNPDILFFFNTQDLNLDANSTSATLTADTTDGKHIRGTDSVKIVPSKK